MNLVLLFPLGLAALAGIVLPLLIHLKRRTEAVPTDFAALRWLDERPRPRQRVRFDEWPLLIVRLLLIGLLALLLARPALYGSDDARPRLLLAPGLEPARLRLPSETDARWLAPGFPAIAQAPPVEPVPLSSLIRQFDAELPAGAPLTIVVPSIVQGLDAARLRLTRRVTWQVVPGAMARAGAAVGTPYLAIAGGANGGERYLRAAAGAWTAPGQPSRVEAVAADALSAPGRTLVRLRAGPVPAAVGDWVERGGTLLLGAEATLAMPGATTAAWRDATGLPLVEGAPLGAGRVLRFTRSLTPAAMPELLEPDFAARLRTAISPPAPPPARAFASDVAPVAGVRPYPLPPRDLTPWLAVLIAALFVIERWLATSRLRGVAP